MSDEVRKKGLIIKKEDSPSGLSSFFYTLS